MNAGLTQPRRPSPRLGCVALVVLTTLTTGCASLSAVRNGPVRSGRRAAWTRIGTTSQGSRTYGVYRGGSVADRARPFGFGAGFKTGWASGGAQTRDQSGVVFDTHAGLTFAFLAFSLSPMISWSTQIVGSGLAGRVQMAQSLPIELEFAFRPLDRLAIYLAAGRSPWGWFSLPGADKKGAMYDGDFDRARIGLLWTLRNGSTRHLEITARIEAFHTRCAGKLRPLDDTFAGAPAKLDWASSGAMLQLDFTGTTLFR